MGMPGPKKINRYGLEFKLPAVRMSEQPGVLVKDVGEARFVSARTCRSLGRAEQPIFAYIRPRPRAEASKQLLSGGLDQS
jgi:hypothetical protein